MEEISVTQRTALYFYPLYYIPWNCYAAIFKYLQMS